MIAAPIPALIAISCARGCPNVNSSPTTAIANPIPVAASHFTLSVTLETKFATPPIAPLSGQARRLQRMRALVRTGYKQRDGGERERGIQDHVGVGNADGASHG